MSDAREPLPETTNLNSTMSTTKTPLWKRARTVSVFGALAGLAVGMAIGLSLGGDPKDSDDYGALQYKYNRVSNMAREQDRQLDEYRDNEVAFDAKQEALDKLTADAQAAKRKADQAKEEKEQAAARARAEREARTIAGDGAYEVGVDVKAGTYKNAGSTNGAYCVAYTSRKPSDIGSYIAGSTNKGPGIVTIHDGEYFTTQFCKDWTRQ